MRGVRRSILAACGSTISPKLSRSRGSKRGLTSFRDSDMRSINVSNPPNLSAIVPKSLTVNT